MPGYSSFALTVKGCSSFICVCVAALASLGYEKTCVLFNCAALASQIAAEQNIDNDEGLKTAAKYYQVCVVQLTSYWVF